MCARLGVVLAPGGSTHDVSLREAHLPAYAWGGCAAAENTGEVLAPVLHAVGPDARAGNESRRTAMFADLPDSHLELQASVRRFAREVVKPRAIEIDRENTYPDGTSQIQKNLLAAAVFDKTLWWD